MKAAPITTIKTVVESMVYEKLGQFFEENPSVARKIIEKSILAAKAREAAFSPAIWARRR